VPLDGMYKANDVDVTLLRSIEKGGIDMPLIDMPLMESVLVADDGTLHQQRISRDTRNSCFRYEFLRKLGNVITTRSNVYAIWITVGYFELEPNGRVDAAHPDGMQLGQELGADTGEITRNRGFFIVDRTIPVAFEPGKNHNVDDCVLLRRYIE
jgi:hypothetical protein